MHVVGHDHVSDQQEFVALANLSQRVYEEVSRPDRVQQRQPPIATKREEVEMAAAVVALQSFRHKTTPTRKTDAWGTLVPFLSGEFQKWYPLIDARCQHRSREECLCHPPTFALRGAWTHPFPGRLPSACALPHPASEPRSSPLP